VTFANSERPGEQALEQMPTVNHAAELAASNGDVHGRWRQASAAGEVAVDEPYSQMALLARIVVDVKDQSDMEAFFESLESRLGAADGSTRSLLVVGLIEDIQNAILNRGLSMEEWRPLLGRETATAWEMVEGVWNGSVS
jgi:hypothetical protein